MERKLFGLLLAIFGLMLWADPAAATPAGTVVKVSGSTTDDGHVLNRGETVQVGDTLEVPTGGNLKLQMADGSVIAVAPDSTMTVANYSIDGSGRDVRLSLARGVLRAQVTSTSGPSTFEISTAVGTASVDSASADWFIKAQPDSGQVGVLAGTIDLRSAVTGESVSIPAHWAPVSKKGSTPYCPAYGFKGSSMQSSA